MIHKAVGGDIVLLNFLLNPHHLLSCFLITPQVTETETSTLVRRRTRASALRRRARTEVSASRIGRRTIASAQKRKTKAPTLRRIWRGGGLGKDVGTKEGRQ